MDKELERLIVGLIDNVTCSLCGTGVKLSSDELEDYHELATYDFEG